MVIAAGIHNVNAYGQCIFSILYIFLFSFLCLVLSASVFLVASWNNKFHGNVGLLSMLGAASTSYSDVCLCFMSTFIGLADRGIFSRTQPLRSWPGRAVSDFDYILILVTEFRSGDLTVTTEIRWSSSPKFFHRRYLTSALDGLLCFCITPCV